MSTLSVDVVQPSTGTNTNLQLKGKGTGKLQIPATGISYAANVTGNVSVTRSLAVGYTDGRVPQANLDVKGNTSISGLTTFGSTIKILGGSPGADKVLTSDADGDASWAAAGGGAWSLISTATPSSSTFLSFTGFDSSTYNNYLFLVAGVTNAGTHSEHRFRMWSSTDGGSSYDDGSNEYSYGKRMQSNSSDNGAQSATASVIEFCGGIDTTGAGADGIATGFVQIPNPQATDTRVRFLFDMTIGDSSTVIYNVNGMYLRDTNADVDAIRFGWLSENFADQGAIYMYGMKKA